MKIIKKIFYIIIIIVLLTLSVGFFYSNEYFWICIKEKWTRHSNPNMVTSTIKYGEDSIVNEAVNKIYITQCGEYGKKEIKIGEIKIFADVADDNCKRKLGLSGRSELEDNSGMIFIFEKVGEYSFWMKDMLFDLDIIWINENKIVYLEKKIPFDFKGILAPQVRADRVLEIKAGNIDRYGFEIGDEVIFY